MKKLLAVILVLIPCVAGAFFFSPGGNNSSSSTTTDASLLVSGTLPAARIADNSILPPKVGATGTPDNTMYLRWGSATGFVWDTPSGSATTTLPFDNVTGIVPVAQGGTGSDNAAGARTNLGADNASNLSTGTIPAARIADNSVTNAKVLDNSILTGKIGDGTILDADISADAGIDAAKIGGGGVSTTEYDYLGSVTSDVQTQLNAKQATITGTDNLTVDILTANEVVSTAADGTHKGNMANSAAASNLTVPGDTAYNLTTGNLVVYDNTIADNVILAAATKTYSFGWDNAVATDTDIFVWPDVGPNALSLVQIKCFASADNVIGVLSECASDNNASCTKVDDTDWTITNAVAGVTVAAAAFENVGIAAGTSLKWTTTSVGAASTNRFSCTVRYREVE